MLPEFMLSREKNETRGLSKHMPFLDCHGVLSILSKISRITET